MNNSAARLKLQNGGEIAVDRERGEATFVIPHRLGTAELVHPLLAPVAAVMAWWLERESFHAGGFVAAGRTWGVIGDRGAGKSTMVAQLALEGVPIVCDDLLVLEGVRTFVAPRSVDLRRGSAERLGVGQPLGVVGARERWRMPVPPLRDEAPIGGWIFLTWGDRLEAKALSGSDRLKRLSVSCGTRLPPRNPDALLELAALPGWELRRPKRWSSLAQSAACLLEAVA